MVVATFMKYTLHVVDYSLDHPWENRNVYLLYGELITGTTSLSQLLKRLYYPPFILLTVAINYSHALLLFQRRQIETFLNFETFLKN